MVIKNLNLFICLGFICSCQSVVDVEVLSAGANMQVVLNDAQKLELQSSTETAPSNVTLLKDGSEIDLVSSGQSSNGFLFAPLSDLDLIVGNVYKIKYSVAGKTYVKDIIFTHSGKVTVKKFAGSARNGLLVSNGDSGNDWSSYYIDEDLTINIPSDYATLELALNFIKTKRIAPLKKVTIKLSDGTYNIASTISLNHIDGKRIHIEGNTTNPENVVLELFDGVKISLKDSFDFGSISGLTLSGNNAVNSRGIHLEFHNSLTLTDSVIIEGFYQGLYISGNSSLDAEGVIARNNTGQAGYIGFNSYVNVQNGSFSNNDIGLYSGSNAVVCADGSTYENNSTYGAEGWFKGYIGTWSSTFTSNSTDTSEFLYSKVEY